MPFYLYECNICKYNFEEFQKMSDKPVEKCPKCGKKKVKRLICPPAGIHFLGSGWSKPTAGN
jgi:putative FmdB family regulatory protein